MNSLHLEVTPVKTKANDLYWQGFHAYCNSNCLAGDLATKEERRGWWAALDAQAESNTPRQPLQTYIDNIDYEAELADLRDAMEEDEYNRRGRWL